MKPTRPILFLVAWLMATGIGLQATPAQAVTVTPPDARPAAHAFDLRSIDGKRVRLSALSGKVVVIAFWATWCVPCRRELGALGELYEAHRKAGLEVLAIATDGPETLSRVRSLARRQRLAMPVLTDRAGRVVARLNPRGNVPFSLFLDRQGRVAYQHGGFAAGDEASYATVIEQLLRESAP